MAPIIEVSEKVLDRLDNLRVPYTLREQDKPSFDLENNFIYVPSTGLYVARQKTFHGKNWFDSHKLLQEQGNRMLTIPEFIESLKYTRDNEKKSTMI